MLVLQVALYIRTSLEHVAAQTDIRSGRAVSAMLPSQALVQPWPILVLMHTQGMKHLDPLALATVRTDLGYCISGVSRNVECGFYGSRYQRITFSSIGMLLLRYMMKCVQPRSHEQWSHRGQGWITSRLGSARESSLRKRAQLVKLTSRIPGSARLGSARQAR